MYATYTPATPFSPDGLRFNAADGTIPAILIDSLTHSVLLLGYMDKRCLLATLEQREVTLVPAGGGAPYVPGSTPGAAVHLHDIRPSFGGDSLLVYVIPEANVAPNGEYSDYDLERRTSVNFLTQLFELIKSRKAEMPEGSVTASLFKAGPEHILRRVQTEVEEMLAAAEQKDRENTPYEIADVIYYLLVLIATADIELEEIVDIMIGRSR